MTRTKQVLTFVATLCALSTGLLNAQSLQVARFTTSFPFYFCDREMPSGSYTVSETYLDDHLLLITNDDQSHSAYVLYIPTQSIQPAAQGWVKFHQYGDARYLSSLTLTGEEAGMEIPPGKAEQRGSSEKRAEASTRSIALQPLVTGL